MSTGKALAARVDVIVIQSLRDSPKKARVLWCVSCGRVVVNGNLLSSGSDPECRQPMSSGTPEECIADFRELSG